jgi:hypothetical protein
MDIWYDIDTLIKIGGYTKSLTTTLDKLEPLSPDISGLLIHILSVLDTQHRILAQRGPAWPRDSHQGLLSQLENLCPGQVPIHLAGPLRIAPIGP